MQQHGRHQRKITDRNRTGCTAPASQGLLRTPAAISQGLSVCPLLAAAGMGLGVPSPACSHAAARWWLPDLDEVLRAGSQVASGSARSLDVCCQNELRCQERAF